MRKEAKVISVKLMIYVILHICEMFSESTKIACLINSIVLKAHRVEEIPHPQARKYLDGNSVPVPAHRERMDWPCRGHIGNLGHGEYFCRLSPPTRRYRGQDGGVRAACSILH